MNTITEMMTADHRACDATFVDLESHVESRDWPRAEAAMAAFRAATLRHFHMEEDVLFPAFEAAMGAGGPAAVMRMEHAQMRSLLDQLAAAVEAHDDKRALSLTESFMVLVQQHNMKEEQILYPMSDNSLSGVPELIERMRAVEP